MKIINLLIADENGPYWQEPNVGLFEFMNAWHVENIWHKTLSHIHTIKVMSSISYINLSGIITCVVFQTLCIVIRGGYSSELDQGTCMWDIEQNIII